MEYKILPFASMPEKESSAEDSDSDDSREYINNKYDDMDIDDNLNTKPSAIDIEKTGDDRVKEPSKRKSQASIYDFVNLKRKSVSKEININIQTADCNSDATGSLNHHNEVTADKMDVLILLKQKELNNGKL